MNTGDLEFSGSEILIVDDEVTARLMGREALEVAGFRVVEATNGRAAVEKCIERCPDIVLLDVVMPELDGFDACAQIRQQPTCHHIPILMMTGLEDVNSINHAYEVGATDFVTKPINYLSLAHRVHYMLRAQRTADELRRSETRIATAQRIAKIGHWVWDDRNGFRTLSEDTYKVLGLSSALDLRTFPDLYRYIHPDDRDQVADTISTALATHSGYSVEHQVVNRHGQTRIIQQEAEFVLSDERSGPHLLGIFQDVTERRRVEEQVHQLSHYDAITGLPNRKLMKRHVEQALQLARRYERTVAILSLDIDHFRRINDTLGHNVGNELLEGVAERLTRVVRKSDGVTREPDDLNDDTPLDTIARLGGDEFIVMLTEIGSAEDAATVARRIRTTLAKPLNLAGEEVCITTSIGISVFPIDGTDADALMRHADSALNHVKQQGRDGYQFYTASMNARAFERLSMETKLRKALEAEQFELFFQPKIALDTMTCVGTEALIRWQHPELGRVSPAHFIPIAEETNLIVPLGEWVIEEACRELRKWKDTGARDCSIAVNLSPAQFREGNLPQLISTALDRYQIDPRLLELEITENLIMEDADATVDILGELKDLGLVIAIDDFGTGYSSLSYLKRLPIDTVIWQTTQMIARSYRL
jgi:PAS domain S-box-containing protein